MMNILSVLKVVEFDRYQTGVNHEIKGFAINNVRNWLGN